MILIVGRDSKEVSELRLRLYRNGIPSRAATVRTVEYHMQKGMYDCLILLSPPAAGARSRFFFRRFHERFSGIPAVLIAEAAAWSSDPAELPDLLIRRPYTPVSLLKDIDRCALRMGARSPLRIRVDTVLHNVRNACFTSFHAMAILPAAETVILHTVMALHPTPISASLLVSLTKKPGFQASASSLAPHICRLNARTYEAFGRKLILFSRKNGCYYYNLKSNNI